MESNGYDQKDVDGIVHTILTSLKYKVVLNRFNQLYVSSKDSKLVYQNFIQEIRLNVDRFLKNIIFTPDINKNDVEKQLKTFLFHGDYTNSIEELAFKITDQELMPKLINVIEPYLLMAVDEYLEGKVESPVIKQSNSNLGTENMEIIEKTSIIEFLNGVNDNIPCRSNIISSIQRTSTHLISNENYEYNFLKFDTSTFEKFCQSSLDKNIIKNHKDEDKKHTFVKNINHNDCDRILNDDGLDIKSDKIKESPSLGIEPKSMKSNQNNGCVHKNTSSTLVKSKICRKDNGRKAVVEMSKDKLSISNNTICLSYKSNETNTRKYKHSLEVKNKSSNYSNVVGKKLKVNELKSRDNKNDSADIFLPANKILHEKALAEVTPENVAYTIEYIKLCLDYIESMLEVHKDSDEKTKLDLDLKLGEEIELVNNKKEIKPFHVGANSNSSVTQITNQCDSNENIVSTKIKLKLVNGNYQIIKANQRKKCQKIFSRKSYEKKRGFYSLQQDVTNLEFKRMSEEKEETQLGCVTKNKNKYNKNSNVTSSNLVYSPSGNENSRVNSDHKKDISTSNWYLQQEIIHKLKPVTVKLVRLENMTELNFSLQCNIKDLECKKISEEKKELRLVTQRLDPFVKKLVNIDTKQNKIDSQKQNIKSGGNRIQKIKTLNRVLRSRNKYNKNNNVTTSNRINSQPDNENCRVNSTLKNNDISSSNWYLQQEIIHKLKPVTVKLENMTEVQKGKNIADSGHVTFVTEVRPPNNYSSITASIIRQTSVTLHPWQVKLEKGLGLFRDDESADDNVEMLEL